ncbi:MAG: S-layer homology domain-containing protein [Oscillospiraceae bacterium]|nr:S-layer homology domain-containing protein [Oscillospiraceae bacterium]MBQ6403527.1 S-layer homology domain-containing protein [Oscillospiraceae bacterium]
MKKRMLTLALAVLMVLALFPFGAAAYDDSGWSEAYRAFVMEDGWKSEPDLIPTTEDYCFVLLYDMNRDDVPELLLCTGNKSYTWDSEHLRSCFFTYADGAVKKLGPCEVGYPVEEVGYAPYSDYPGLFVERHGPYYYGYYYSLENGAVSRELVLDTSGGSQIENVALRRLASGFIGHNMPDEVGTLMPYSLGKLRESSGGWEEFALASAARQHFVDVLPGTFSAPGIAWAMKNGVTNGTAEHHFAPESPCTRAQIVTFLWRAAGKPEPKGTENTFSDVPTDAYYAKAVQWAVEQEITNGTSEHQFSPESPCTRAQVVTFLWRSAGKPNVEPRPLSFKDVQADTYYTQAVIWAIAEGVTNGTSPTTFSPDQTCSRGQIVTFLYRRQA